MNTVHTPTEKALSILKGFQKLNAEHGAGITGALVRWYLNDRGLSAEDVTYIDNEINHPERNKPKYDALSDEAFKEKHGIGKPWDAKDAGMVIASNLSDIQHLIGAGQYTEAYQRCNVIKSYVFDTRSGDNFRELKSTEQ